MFLAMIDFKDQEIISTSMKSILKYEIHSRNTKFKGYLYVQKLGSILSIEFVSKYVTLYAYLILLYAYGLFKNLSTCTFILSLRVSKLIPN